MNLSEIARRNVHHRGPHRRKPSSGSSILDRGTGNSLMSRFLPTVICASYFFFSDINNCLPGVRISQQIRHTCAQEGTSAGR